MPTNSKFLFLRLYSICVYIYWFSEEKGRQQEVKCQDIERFIRMAKTNGRKPRYLEHRKLLNEEDLSIISYSKNTSLNGFRNVLLLDKTRVKVQYIIQCMSAVTVVVMTLSCFSYAQHMLVTPIIYMPQV